jgi:hypothetical protein
MAMNAINYVSVFIEEEVSVGDPLKNFQVSARVVPRCGLERYGTETV